MKSLAVAFFGNLELECFAPHLSYVSNLLISLFVNTCFEHFWNAVECELISQWADK